MTGWFQRGPDLPWHLLSGTGAAFCRVLDWRAGMPTRATAPVPELICPDCLEVAQVLGLL